MLTTEHEQRLRARGQPGPAGSLQRDAPRVDAVVSTIGFPLVAFPLLITAALRPCPLHSCPCAPHLLRCFPGTMRQHSMFPGVRTWALAELVMVSLLLFV